MKIKLTSVPQDSKLKAGDLVDVSGAEADTLKASGHEYITDAEDKLLKAREATVDATIQASKAFAPKQDTSVIKARAMKMEETEPGLGIAYINSQQAAPESELGKRITASASREEIPTGSRIETIKASFRDAVKDFFATSKPDFDKMKEGGFIRACCKTESEMKDGVLLAHEKSRTAKQVYDMIRAGSDFRLTDEFIKATADNYADSAGALGVLNTAITLLWDFGHLENELAMFDDITTDISGTPVKYNEWARSRYIKVPGVQTKAIGTAWTGVAGNDVDVSILMNNYAGVMITVENQVLGSTARPLINEQKTPQLYGLAEYMMYTLINTAINGSTRFANDGTTTSTITAASAFVDPTFGKGYFNVAMPPSGSLLPTFVGPLRMAMNMSKFPGGNEPPGSKNLMRYVWVNSILESSIAQDSAFELNQSIQGIRQNTEENLIQTGMFTRIGNNKFRASQLVLDNNSTTGTGATQAAALFVVPGTPSTAKVVGIGGTRSGLMFVSRMPLDYTKIMPEIPSTAAIELFTSPKIGIPFMVVKYLDHGMETANMRVSCMWGSGIGDERQLMLLRQQ